MPRANHNLIPININITKIYIHLVIIEYIACQLATYINLTDEKDTPINMAFLAVVKSSTMEIILFIFEN